MRLDLTEILANVGKRMPYEIEEPPLVNEDIECGSPVVGNAVFTNTGNALLLAGVVSTELVLCCGRCLEYYRLPLELELDEQFPLETRVVGSKGRRVTFAVEEDENPDAGKLFDGPVLDLTEMLRQNLAVAIPLQPLHDPDCKGLCPMCGSNRNVEKCSCRTNAPTGALRGLAALLDDSQE